MSRWSWGNILRLPAKHFFWLASGTCFSVGCRDLTPFHSVTPFQTPKIKKSPKCFHFEDLPEYTRPFGTCGWWWLVYIICSGNFIFISVPWPISDLASITPFCNSTRCLLIGSPSPKESTFPELGLGIV